MATKTEDIEGYVVDIACIRKYPRHELLDRAKAHTRECGLMGHCVESGYGLIADDGTIHLLEPAATPGAVQAIRGAVTEQGIRLKAHREMKDEEMKTTSIEALN